MKKILTTTTLTILLIAVTSFSQAMALSPARTDITAEREARTAKIEALYEEIRSGRLSRSEKIEAQLQIARLEAEARKERRQQDRIRDREAALNR